MKVKVTMEMSTGAKVTKEGNGVMAFVSRDDETDCTLGGELSGKSAMHAIRCIERHFPGTVTMYMLGQIVEGHGSDPDKSSDAQSEE